MNIIGKCPGTSSMRHFIIRYVIAQCGRGFAIRGKRFLFCQGKQEQPLFDHRKTLY